MSAMRQRVLAMLALAVASAFAVAVEQAESSAQPTKPAEKKDRLRAGERSQDVLPEDSSARRRAGFVYIHPIVSHCGLDSRADGEPAVDCHGMPKQGQPTHGRHRSSDDVRTARRQYIAAAVGNTCT
jgi:hypothetical protein